MPPRNHQLTMSNLKGYVGQINEITNEEINYKLKTAPDTNIKLLCRAAKCLSNAGDIKNMNIAIEFYTKAYETQSEIRGLNHTRTLDILKTIIQCENKLEKMKKNRLDTIQRNLEANMQDEAEKKEQEEKKEKKKQKKEKKQKEQEEMTNSDDEKK